MIPNSIAILYEDDDVLVINKPAGLVVHPDGRTAEPTLVDWILKHYPKMKGVGEPLRIESRIKNQELGNGKAEISAPNSEFVIHNSKIIDRPGVVHRIDRDTSGVLILAKTQEAHACLKQQFQNRAVDKTYHTLVWGEIKENEGKIDRPIGRSKKDFRMWSAQRGARGEMREAVTLYRVLERNRGFSLVEAKPQTGRTHQIRVHFKAINHPVVCDKLYAASKECAFGLDRLALHAFSVTFATPNKGEIAVTAPYPGDFKAAVEAFRG